MLIPFAIPWPKLLKAAPWLLLALALIGLQITRSTLATARAEHKAFIAEVERQTAQARADDIAHARAVETAQNQVREEVSRDLETKLASARAAADDYARRLRNAQAQGGGVRTNLPSAAQPAVDPSVPGPTTELDDARACADAVVKAEGWREWWAQVSEVPR